MERERASKRRRAARSAQTREAELARASTRRREGPQALSESLKGGASELEADSN